VTSYHAAMPMSLSADSSPAATSFSTGRTPLPTTGVTASSSGAIRNSGWWATQGSSSRVRLRDSSMMIWRCSTETKE